jgi:hypothetical protein
MHRAIRVHNDGDRSGFVALISGNKEQESKGNANGQLELLD